MRQQDFVRLVGQSVVAHRLRSTLTALGIGIGVTAVVLLTSAVAACLPALRAASVAPTESLRAE